MPQLPVPLTLNRKLTFNFNIQKIARLVAQSNTQRAAQNTARKTAQLDQLRRQRIAARVAAIVCSQQWEEAAAQAAEAMGLDPNRAKFDIALRERGIYPPPADLGFDQMPRRGAVRMRRCDACGRIVPPNNLAHHQLVRVCDDCRIEPDDAADLSEHEIARAPGAHFGALVRGHSAEMDASQSSSEAAQTRLARLGLTEQEIVVLAFLVEGYSTRRVAQFVQRSQTFVRKLRASAERKLHRSG